MALPKPCNRAFWYSRSVTERTQPVRCRTDAAPNGSSSPGSFGSSSPKIVQKHLFGAGCGNNTFCPNPQSGGESNTLSYGREAPGYFKVDGQVTGTITFTIHGRVGPVSIEAFPDVVQDSEDTDMISSAASTGKPQVSCPSPVSQTSAGSSCSIEENPNAHRVARQAFMAQSGGLYSHAARVPVVTIPLDLKPKSVILACTGMSLAATADFVSLRCTHANRRHR
ncbi:predicted protein [Chaetomium globosum CBS 148.51]|uniref:Uncharacterized protein n=1 Tax=Chaetomium globosum (strain ATCC 6205 / CBS 148.51 / DSM 1962 / NBRC 6347 / NRRL 1970) TaxID=306901 RepID=Q2GMW0_CHAGB|nr:uncharacterized protein CHGG_10694 [Chaetomium globosum CBS 148.51]EAQ84290.1 predicted protein [Chaetomium globosum CBS 148.51]